MADQGGLLSDPDLGLNLGLSLLAAGGKNLAGQGNVGTALAGGLQNYYGQKEAKQRLATGNLQLQQLQQEMPMRMDWLKSVGQMLHGANNAPPEQIAGLLGGLPQSAPNPQGAPPAPQGQQMPTQDMPPSPQGMPPPPPQSPLFPQAGPPPSGLGIDPMQAVNTGIAGSVLGMRGADAFTKYPESIANAQKALQTQKQMQVQGRMALLDSVASSPDAHKMISASPDLQALWGQTAPQLGMDPKELTPENARSAARFQYNQLAGSAGLPVKEMPSRMVDMNGANGQRLQVDPITGKETEVTGQKLPNYAMEKRWNPTTGRDEGIMVQTSPGGTAAPSAPGPGSSGLRSPLPQLGGRSTTPKGGLGQQASAPIDLGFEKPSADNLKAANFANYARSNIPMLLKMEEGGYRMSPSNRAAVIDAAANDDSGKLSQWLSQEVLAHKLNAQDQAYMAALMPVLQASGHSMSGARLTQSQMRTNFESLIPVESKDSAYLSTVAANRQHLYNGLLAQSGSAAQMPEFRSSLGADRAAQAATVSGKSAPVVGTVSRGYKYVGGDPKAPASWVKAGG